MFNPGMKWELLTTEHEGGEDNANQCEADEVEANDCGNWGTGDDTEYWEAPSVAGADEICERRRETRNAKMNVIEQMDEADENGNHQVQQKTEIAAPQMRLEFVKFCAECGLKFKFDADKFCTECGARRQCKL